MYTPRFLLFALFCSLLHTTLQAQVLPEVGAYWYYASRYGSPADTPDRLYYSIYDSETIDAHQYFILGSFEVNEDSEEVVGDLIPESKIYLTEVNGKVLFLEDEVQYTLVDFNAAVGETLFLSTPSNYGFYNMTCCSFGNENDYEPVEGPLNLNFEAIVTEKTLVVEDGVEYQKIEIQGTDLGSNLTFSFTEKVSLPEFHVFGPCCTGGFDGFQICYHESEVHVGALDCQLVISGIADDNSKLRLYPNPFTSQLNFNSTQDIKSLRVFDTSGMLLQTIQNPEGGVNLSFLSSGLYLVSISYADGAEDLRKVIKH